jgi:putative YjhG/YagF family dehydratase
MALRSAQAVIELEKRGLKTRDILTDASIRNAMVVHAAFGGSTNLLLHIPAIAHAAGLHRPSVEDWIDVNRLTPRLVSVLPNGPVYHPTVRAFLSGGVPEVMLHLRNLKLLDTSALTVTGKTLGENLNAWETSERRQRFRAILQEQDDVNADDVILPPAKAKACGLTSTVAFPRGNLAPEGAVIKSTAIDPSVVDSDGIYHLEGPARVFTSEKSAIAAIKQNKISPGDIMVLTGLGPMGTGMEETYQITSALKYLPFGKKVALLTDARFSGVSTGACIGHIGPEALSGGPIGKVREGDTIRIVVDRNQLEASIDFVGEAGRKFSSDEGAKILASRSSHPDLKPNPNLPDDTRLWAILQDASGGTWGGCAFDVEKIIDAIQSGKTTRNNQL